MKIQFLTLLFLSGLFAACSSGEQARLAPAPTPTPEYQNKGHQLVATMVEKVGDYSMLNGKKDVVYTYTYQTPDGKKDVSTEKYIFDKELSYARYEQHERTLPQLTGLIEQGYDGTEFWLKHDGKELTDEEYMKRVRFNRPTNFYWFAMMQKLLDPGLVYEYIGEKAVDGQDYDIVKVTFSDQPEKPTDIYQLYINKETSLVDQFLFTVADFGVMEAPFLMKVTYEEIDGMLIPTQRKYKPSTWEATVSDEPWITVNWTNIKFGNQLSNQDFKK